MRRPLEGTVLVCLALACLIVAGPAQSSRVRKVEEPYGPWTAMMFGGDNAPFAPQDVRPGERYVSAKFRDETGTVIPGRIGQDIDGDGWPEYSKEFCGKIDNYRLRAGSRAPVVVSFIQGRGSDCSPAWASVQGKVVFQFTRGK